MKECFHRSCKQFRADGVDYAEEPSLRRGVSNIIPPKWYAEGKRDFLAVLTIGRGVLCG